MSQITSWTLLQAQNNFKINDLKGVCVNCPNALWRMQLLNQKETDEIINKYNDEYYSHGDKEAIVLTCFCTLIHEYQLKPIFVCDGNPPQEPTLK